MSNYSLDQSAAEFTLTLDHRKNFSIWKKSDGYNALKFFSPRMHIFIIKFLQKNNFVGLKKN